MAHLSVNLQHEQKMVVIKGKEKKLKKRLKTAQPPISAEAKRKLKRPQDTQPIATVAV